MVSKFNNPGLRTSLPGSILVVTILGPWPRTCKACARLIPEGLDAPVYPARANELWYCSRFEADALSQLALYNNRSNHERTWAGTHQGESLSPLIPLVNPFQGGHSRVDF